MPTPVTRREQVRAGGFRCGTARHYTPRVASVPGVAMPESGNDLLRKVARLATELGPALKPAGHQELVASITATARQVFGAHGCSIALLDPDREHLVFYVAS